MSGMVEMKSEFCGLRISRMNYVVLESNYWMLFNFVGIYRKTGRSGFGGEFDKSGEKIENFAFIFGQFFGMSLAQKSFRQTAKFQAIRYQKIPINQKSSYLF